METILNNFIANVQTRIEAIRCFQEIASLNLDEEDDENLK